MVHRQLFPAQCACSCPPASLLPLSSLSHIYAAIIIRHSSHHITYILLYLLSHLSATSILLMSQSPRVSAAVNSIHPYPPPLSSSVSDSVVIINLCLPSRSYMVPSTLYRISASVILIVLHLCRISAVAVSVIMCLCRCRSPFLRPRYVPLYCSSCAPQLMISGAAFCSFRRLCSNRGGGRRRRSSRATARHCLGPPMFRFGGLRQLQPYAFRLRDAIFFSQGNRICSYPGISLTLPPLS